MLFLRVLTGLLAVCLAGAGGAFAGEPIEKTQRCPFGNESVSFVSTLSCSEFGSTRRMSLAPVTSCDFIDRLPQCKKSKLPLYRDFSREDGKFLKKFSKTPAYAEAAQISRYYLAFVIENELAPENIESQLGILLNGLWYDSANTYQNDIYFRAFSDVMNIYTKTASQEDKDFFRAVGAYGLVQRGNLAKAREIIRAVRRSPAAKGTFLLDYVARVETCFETPQATECQPDFEVELVE